MIRLIKFLVTWAILILSLLLGGWIGADVMYLLVETFGVLNVVWAMLALCIGVAVAFVAWQITEETDESKKAKTD